MKITNLLFWVQDSDIAEKFYKKLGFEVVRSDRSDDDHSVVRLGGFEIILQNMRDDEMFNKDALAGDKGKGMYLYIAVDDVDAAHAELVQKGLSPTTQPRDWPWGNREFIIKDPDGYKLCFWQPIKV